MCSVEMSIVSPFFRHSLCRVRDTTCEKTKHSFAAAQVATADRPTAVPRRSCTPMYRHAPAPTGTSCSARAAHTSRPHHAPNRIDARYLACPRAPSDAASIGSARPGRLAVAGPFALSLSLSRAVRSVPRRDGGGDNDRVVR